MTESYVKENTKAIYIETPTNPMMNVTDIRKMADIAKRHNLILIVDNTFMSPYFQNPLDPESGRCDSQRHEIPEVATTIHWQALS